MKSNKKPVTLSERKLLAVDDAAEILQVSNSSAYRIIRKLNAELKEQGKITIAGRVSAKFFYEHTYL